MAEPDDEPGKREVPDQLVQERRLEGGVVAELRGYRQPVLRRYLQAPGQVRRAAEQFLVEVVADPADALGDQQAGRHRVHEHRDVAATFADPPDTDRDRQRYRAPDPEPAIPYGQHPVPDVRDVHRGGDVEVDPAADDAGGHAPQGDVVHSSGSPPTARQRRRVMTIAAVMPARYISA